MADFGFVGPSYTAQSIYQDAQECINLRPEVDPTLPQGDRNVIALYGTPGLKLVGQFQNQAEVRGIRAIAGGNQMVVVCGQFAYAVNTSFDTNYLIGQLNTSSGPVSITDNGVYAYITDGGSRYCWRINDAPRARAVATFAGNTMTVTKIDEGTLQVGMQVLGNNMPPTTIITAIPATPLGAYTVNNVVNITTPTNVFINSTASQMLSTVPRTGAYISGNRLFAGNVTGTIYLGQTLVSLATTLTPNTIIVATEAEDTALTGTGGNGTYTVSFPNDAGAVQGATVGLTGSGYINPPTLVVNAPLNPQGEQAIVLANSITVVSSSIAAGGSGYVVGQALSAVGGIFTAPFVCSVATVDGTGAILTVNTLTTGTYSSAQSTPFRLDQGTKTPTGTGATINLVFGLRNDFTVVNPGSGYLQNATATVQTRSGDPAPTVLATVNLTQGVTPTTSTFYGLYFSQLPSNDGAFGGGISVDVIDNLFVYSEPGTQRFAVSDILSPITNGLSFSLKSGSPDDVIAIAANNREVFVIGERSTEIWVNQGLPIFPLARVPGAATQHGCSATFSVAKLGNSIAYVSRNARGDGQIVVFSDGYFPKVISTHAVEASIANQKIEDARAFTYQLAGHEVYVVTFPSLELTWAYDIATNMWHKWQSWDPVNNRFLRLRVATSTNFNGNNIAGDVYNGKLYILDNDTYTEDGEVIHRVRRAPHIVADYKQEYFSSLQIYFEPGVGPFNLYKRQNDPTSGVRFPQASMRWSNDGGSTWSNEYWRDVGSVGQYLQRAIWRRMGRTRDRIYELRLTDPVKWVIVSAELQGEAGDH